MSESLGQTLIVDNRASNNGVFASELCAKANPDGYTICVGNSGTHAVNATLYKKLPYDVIRDFAAVSAVLDHRHGRRGEPEACRARRLPELVAYAKKNPGKTNIAIPGATGQLAGDALWARLGIEMNNVHYKGSAPSEMAVVAGESQISLLTPLATMNHIASGRIKPYGITSAQRHPLLPQVPTVAEQGVQGYDFQFWNGMFAPKKISDRNAAPASQSGAVRAQLARSERALRRARPRDRRQYARRVRAGGADRRGEVSEGDIGVGDTARL